MNIKATNNMKQQIRELGRKVRGGQATESEAKAFDRIDSALTYINTRRNRVRTRSQAWYDLPIARHMWEADARDLRA